MRDIFKNLKPEDLGRPFALMRALPAPEFLKKFWDRRRRQMSQQTSDRVATAPQLGHSHSRDGARHAPLYDRHRREARHRCEQRPTALAQISSDGGQAHGQGDRGDGDGLSV
jgi:hypothetical protein